ncbi:hypothetical protein [Streptomyces anulatus]|uniref:hypothetical protein n=1 Tax=Streptomyces anulatus TaxID=1892 RepID=UPI00364DDFA0
MSDVLSKLTASHDGGLVALADVLTAVASFYSDLGQAPDPHTAKRLQYLVEHRLGVIYSDLTHMRNDLADRHQDHPQRRVCAAEVGPDEPEASAVCACPPPPPRLATSPAAPPAAPAHAPAARPRRWPRPLSFSEETMPDPTPDTGLGSFAAVLAGELPGDWTSTDHPDRGGLNAHHVLSDRVWDMNDVAEALAKHNVDHCAVLARHDGTRLFVAQQPGPGEGYLIAAMAPDEVPDEAFSGVREPDGIAVEADPSSAAADVTLDLLPRYYVALGQARGNADELAMRQAGPQRVVMRWDDGSLVVDKPDRRDIALALTENGFTFDPDRDVYVLAGDDTNEQAASARAARARLSTLGLGVQLRHPQARPALGTAPAAPLPTIASPHRSR